MEYRFYNGINSYQLRDFFRQLGYQATYTNSSTLRLCNMGSNIRSGSAVIAELSREGKPSHVVVFDEYTNRVLVGFNPSYNNEKSRIVMVYGDKPKCYNLTGYAAVKIPTGRSSFQLYRTEEEYNKLVSDVSNLKDSILHRDGNVSQYEVENSIDYSSETMVDWAKDDTILNQVLIDVLDIDENQVGLYVDGTPSETQ